MKTFKVAFFDKNLDLVTIETYHNVVNQSLFLRSIAYRVVSCGFLPSVQCLSTNADGITESYTSVVNEQLHFEIKEIEPNYISDFYA